MIEYSCEILTIFDGGSVTEEQSVNSTIQVIGGEKCVNSHKTATIFIAGENSGLNSHNIKPCK